MNPSKTHVNAQSTFSSLKAAPGFTLMETIVATALATLVIVFTSSFFIFVSKGYYNMKAQSEMSMQLRTTLSKLSEDSMMASSFEISDAKDALTVTFSDGRTIRYWIDSTMATYSSATLMRSDESDTSSRSLVQNVEDFDVQFVNGSTEQIKITIDIDKEIHGALNVNESIVVQYSKRN